MDRILYHTLISMPDVLLQKIFCNFEPGNNNRISLSKKLQNINLINCIDNTLHAINSVLHLNILFHFHVHIST